MLVAMELMCLVLGEIIDRDVLVGVKPVVYMV